MIHHDDRASAKSPFNVQSSHPLAGTAIVPISHSIRPTIHALADNEGRSQDDAEQDVPGPNWRRDCSRRASEYINAASAAHLQSFTRPVLDVHPSISHLARSTSHNKHVYENPGSLPRRYRYVLLTTSQYSFLTCTLGYVGGTVLSRMIATPSLLDKLDLTLYVRSPEKARRLTSELGLKTAVGTLADLDKLEQLSEQAHLVISIVSLASSQSYRLLNLYFRPTQTTLI